MFHCKALIIKEKTIVLCFFPKKLSLAEKILFVRVAPQVQADPRGGYDFLRTLEHLEQYNFFYS